MLTYKIRFPWEILPHVLFTTYVTTLRGQTLDPFKGFKIDAYHQILHSAVLFCHLGLFWAIQDCSVSMLNLAFPSLLNAVYSFSILYTSA